MKHRDVSERKRPFCFAGCEGRNSHFFMKSCAAFTYQKRNTTPDLVNVPNLSKNDNSLLTNEEFCARIDLSKDDKKLSQNKFLFLKGVSHMRNKKVQKVLMVIAKVLEVFHLLGAVGMVVLLVLGASGSELLQKLFDQSSNGFMTFNSLELGLYDAAGNLMPSAVVVGAISGLFACLLGFMVFRNLYLILKTTMGKTKFSKGETPFQKDNVRMVREIGYFCIAMPLVNLLICVIAGIVTKNLEMSVNFSSVLMGIVALSLSQYFSYGEKLESEVEGMI